MPGTGHRLPVSAIVVAAVGSAIALRGAPFWNTVDRRIWGVLIGEQATRLISGLARAWAIAHGVPVVLLSALSGVQPAWVWVLAILFLDERVRRHDILFKGGGIIGTALGVYLLI